MKKQTYIKCPRCELNYIFAKDKFCEVCKKSMRAGSLAEDDEYDYEEEGLELCPICKLNYLNDGETICATCEEENLSLEKDNDTDDWKDYVDKSVGDDDEELDLLPVEDEDDAELNDAFAKELDEEYGNDEEDDDLSDDEEFDDLDLDIDFDDEDDDDDDEDDDDEDDDDDDDEDDD